MWPQRFRQNLLKLGLAAGLSLLVLSPAPTLRADSAGRLRITQVDAARFPLITVYIAAVDAAGAPVVLDPAQLQIREAGARVPAQPAAATAGLVTTLLVVDGSDAARAAGAGPAIQTAVETFSAALLPGDQAGLMSFDAQSHLLQPITANRSLLVPAAEGLTPAPGGAALYDTVLAGAQALAEFPGRKALFVVTAGPDTASAQPLAEGLGQAQSVSILELGAAGHAVLRRLAEQAGGQYAVVQPAAAAAVLQQWERALQAEYAVTYRAPDARGAAGPHTVTISLPAYSPAETQYWPAAAPPADAGWAGMWEALGLLLVGLLGVPVLATAATLAVAWPARRRRAGSPPRPRPVRTPREPLPAFPNYLQLRAHAWLPAWFWRWFWNLGRLAGVVALGAYVVVLFLEPAAGLLYFWRLTVPVLPALFLVAPGVWRNLCPLAASNQTPRWLKFTRALTPPAWLTEYGFVIGLTLFFGLASSRKWLFNTSGPATAVLILAALASAWLGGYLFKGKSGWCSSLCPLYPVQRLYNQTPFATVANAHCDPCVGCTKHCYDFSPRSAYLADLHDDDPHYAAYRKFFAAAMPGFIVAFFTVPDPAGWHAVLAMYGQFALLMVVSVGVFYLLQSFLKISINQLTSFYGAAAFNLYYAFALPGWLTALSGLLGWSSPVWLAWVLQAGLLALTGLWVIRTRRKETQFLAHLVPVTAGAPARAGPLAAAGPVVAAGPAEIVFLPNDTRVPVTAGRTLLEIAEAQNQPLEAGCRMGVCGADPVAILEGMEHLPPVGADEKSTLERLGLGPHCRLACMCRVAGPVKVSLDTKAAPAAAAPVAPALAAPPPPPAAANFDHHLKRVVIIGNGIAGVTAADTVRRHHPECEIHLVGREKHPLYNRMAITRLIYGRSAMSGLYLQPEAWYDERRIVCWLNTHATHINRGHRTVSLATGESLPYDRLILASGSSSAVPSWPGAELAGVFGLREAEEAMDIRAYVQQNQGRAAVVAGGGLLGLEAAYALHKLGLTVWVLERGAWLLRRQLDERGGQILHQQLEALGLTILTGAETAAILGEARVTAVTLTDGRTVPADVFLAAVGIQPNVDLARSAGLAINRGVLVDETMRTSAPKIFAAGDVCEFSQEVPGLWPVAVEQAKVAALTALGEPAAYRPGVPVTMLKVVGVEVTSVGRFEARSAAEFEIVPPEADEQHYRKLVVAAGRLVGAILIGYPQDAPAVAAAVKEGRDIRYCVEDLRAGRWERLREPAPPPPLPAQPRRARSWLAGLRRAGRVAPPRVKEQS